MNDADIKKQFDHVMESMVVARLLASYTFTDGKGFHLTWTTDGAKATSWLKKWIRKIHLAKADERPLLMTELAFGFLPHPESNPKTINDFFRLLRRAGLASKAKFAKGTGAQLEWLPIGKLFCAEYSKIVDTLGLRGNEDGLIVMVQIIEGWAFG